MNEYKFTIKYDGGTHKLTTRAQDLSAALHLVMNAEKCPERAIINIKITEAKK
jgi:hypothetical protein